MGDDADPSTFRFSRDTEAESAEADYGESDEVKEVDNGPASFFGFLTVL